MQVIENEHPVAYDIDQTLFMHSDNGIDSIINPYSGSVIKGYLNLNHAELLKQHHGRGKFVIVWSKAGVKWAEAVLNHFGLNQYVDLVITKLDQYVDDLPADKILGEHVYLK